MGYFQGERVVFDQGRKEGRGIQRFQHILSSAAALGVRLFLLLSSNGLGRPVQSGWKWMSREIVRPSAAMDEFILGTTGSLN